MASQHYIFHGVHISEKFDILKCTGNSKLGYLVRFFPLNFFPFKKNLTPIRFVDSVNTVKQRGLPGPIGADD